jgi:hypothetical protein
VHFSGSGVAFSAMRANVVTAIIAIGVGATSVACGSGPATGETRTLTRTIELDRANAVAVTIEMGAGELRVQGGAPTLMSGSFKFNVASWEPQVAYSNDGAHAALSIKQPGTSVSFGKVENTWDLRLNDTVPVDFAAKMGAGDVTMTLGTMNLQRVDVQLGAGNLRLDLRGAPKQGYDVRVNGGVGEAHIQVPRGVGVTATASGALGGISVHGLEKRGDVWLNPEHEHDPVAIRLDVKGGVGQIDISAE